MRFRYRLTAMAIAAVLIIGLGIYIATHLQIDTIVRSSQKNNTASPGAVKVSQGLAELPDEKTFQTVGENDRLRLKLDPKTGHFLVEDKKDGRIWRSYPDPAQWPKETTGSLWRTHLRSPIMIQYADLYANKTQPKETNLLEERGTIKDLQIFDGGFRLTFDMPSKQLAIPIEVKLENDSVTTRIIDSGIKEGKISLLWVRLYPFFGAERSEGQDGYTFIPDGSGALIPYDPASTNVNRIYQEPVFGEDFAFKINTFDPSRLRDSMPVYGAKNENRGFLTILEDGAEYADIIASPSGVLSTYNWVTNQANYRLSYRQVTNREKDRSFITYSKDERFHGDRVTRYVMLDSQDSNYVGMAKRYRDYLQQKYKLSPIKPKSNKVPMDLVIVGGDTAKGLVWDRYVKATTTSEAMQMVQRLYGLGIDNMTVRYWGWQEGGIGEDGGRSKVEPKLGGDKGMKEFVNFAHSLDIPVYLRMDYSRNTSRTFINRIYGVRDMGGTPIEKLVSLPYTMKNVEKDIPYYKSLGVDGIEVYGMGQFLNSDFNSRYASSRGESLKLQQDIINKLREGVGHVLGDQSNFYAVPMMDSVKGLPESYSGDLFSSTGVPFAQIALHGLIPYNSGPSNERQEFRKQFLQDLEYGSNPSYQFTYSASEDLKYVQNIYFFSPAYKDWEQTAVEEYQKWNDALGDVQDQFIVNHRSLTNEVKETTYANGKRIVVNYGVTPYTYEGKTVGAQDYLVVKGGGS